MKPSLLIVDDQIMMIHFLTYYFKQKYEVNTKNDGLDALAWLEEGNIPDIILADIDMPLLNGFEFIKSIKTNETLKHLPIIMLSSRSNIEDQLYCIELGAADYLTKPFNPEDLESIIQKVIIANSR